MSLSKLSSPRYLFPLLLFGCAILFNHGMAHAEIPSTEIPSTKVLSTEILSTEWSIEQQASTATEPRPLALSSLSIHTTPAAQEGNTDLIHLLEEEQLQRQLIQYGVDPKVVKAKIAALTPAERQLLQNHIDSQPAGGGLISVAAILFMFFVVTDMLCATDLFSFVNCINK